MSYTNKSNRGLVIATIGAIFLGNINIVWGSDPHTTEPDTGEALSTSEGTPRPWDHVDTSSAKYQKWYDTFCKRFNSENHLLNLNGLAYANKKGEIEDEESCRCWLAAFKNVLKEKKVKALAFISNNMIDMKYICAIMHEVYVEEGVPFYIENMWFMNDEWIGYSGINLILKKINQLAEIKKEGPNHINVKIAGMQLSPAESAELIRFLENPVLHLRFLFHKEGINIVDLGYFKVGPEELTKDKFKDTLKKALYTYKIGIDTIAISEDNLERLFKKLEVLEVDQDLLRPQITFTLDASTITMVNAFLRSHKLRFSVIKMCLKGKINPDTLKPLGTTLSRCISMINTKVILFGGNPEELENATELKKYCQKAFIIREEMTDELATAPASKLPLDTDAREEVPISWTLLTPYEQLEECLEQFEYEKKFGKDGINENICLSKAEYIVLKLIDNGEEMAEKYYKMAKKWDEMAKKFSEKRCAIIASRLRRFLDKYRFLAEDSKPDSHSRLFNVAHLTKFPAIKDDFIHRFNKDTGELDLSDYPYVSKEDIERCQVSDNERCQCWLGALEDMLRQEKIKSIVFESTNMYTMEDVAQIMERAYYEKGSFSIEQISFIDDPQIGFCGINSMLNVLNRLAERDGHIVNVRIEGMKFSYNHERLFRDYILDKNTYRNIRYFLGRADKPVNLKYLKLQPDNLTKDKELLSYTLKWELDTTAAPETALKDFFKDLEINHNAQIAITLNVSTIEKVNEFLSQFAREEESKIGVIKLSLAGEIPSDALEALGNTLSNNTGTAVILFAGNTKTLKNATTLRKSCRKAFIVGEEMTDELAFMPVSFLPLAFSEEVKDGVLDLTWVDIGRSMNINMLQVVFNTLYRFPIKHIIFRNNYLDSQLASEIAGILAILREDRKKLLTHIECRNNCITEDGVNEIVMNVAVTFPKDSTIKIEMSGVKESGDFDCKKCTTFEVGKKMPTLEITIDKSQYILERGGFLSGDSNRVSLVPLKK